jgi:hypothetical protein
MGWQQELEKWGGELPPSSLLLDLPVFLLVQALITAQAKRLQGFSNFHQHRPNSRTHIENTILATPKQRVKGPV